LVPFPSFIPVLDMMVNVLGQKLSVSPYMRRMGMKSASCRIPNIFAYTLAHRSCVTCGYLSLAVCLVRLKSETRGPSPNVHAPFEAPSRHVDLEAPYQPLPSSRVQCSVGGAVAVGPSSPTSPHQRLGEVKRLLAGIFNNSPALLPIRSRFYVE
jgi:hypothetical protein